MSEETDELVIARRLLAAGKPEEALEFAKRELERYPEDEEVMYYVGACYFHLDDFARAEEFFRMASETEPAVEYFAIAVCAALWRQHDKTTEAVEFITRNVSGRKPEDVPRFRGAILGSITNTIYPGPRYDRVIEALKSMPGWTEEIPRLQAEALDELRRDMVADEL